MANSITLIDGNDNETGKSTAPLSVVLRDS